MDKPFSLIRAILAKVIGNVNKYFPPKANKIEKIINPIISKILKLLDIFFAEILLITLSIK